MFYIPRLACTTVAKLTNKGQTYIYDALVIIAVIIIVPVLYLYLELPSVRTDEEKFDEIVQDLQLLHGEVEHTSKAMSSAEFDLNATSAKLYCKPNKKLILHVRNSGVLDIESVDLTIYITSVEEFKEIEKIPVKLKNLPAGGDWQEITVYPSHVEFGKKYYIETYASFYTTSGYQLLEDEIVKLNCTVES